MVIITIIIAFLVLLFVLMFQLSWYDPRVPCIFEITKVRHTDLNGRMVDDGYVVLKNTGSVAYENWNLYALTYVNDNPVVADLPTLNADEWINTPGRRGVKNIGEAGSGGTRQGHNAFWHSQASLFINYNNHLIHYGDRVTIEIYNKSSGEIVSRDTFPHTDEKVKAMMDKYFSRQGA